MRWRSFSPAWVKSQNRMASISNQVEMCPCLGGLPLLQAYRQAVSLVQRWQSNACPCAAIAGACAHLQLGAEEFVLKWRIGWRIGWYQVSLCGATIAR